jgi:hypothetical protein
MKLRAYKCDLAADFKIFVLKTVGIRVSALEQTLPLKLDEILSDTVELKHFITARPHAHSYHSVNVDGDEIHRTGKQGLATNHTK